MNGPFLMYCSAMGMVVGSMKSVMKDKYSSPPDPSVAERTFVGLEGVRGLFMMKWWVELVKISSEVLGEKWMMGQ